MALATTRRTPNQRQRGASLVEFALAAPLLFLLLFGTIEFGWAFYQELNVRHGAREAIRLAAVDASPANGESTQVRNIAREVCNRMDAEPGGGILVTIDAGAAIGDEVTVTVRKPLRQLTGMFSVGLDGIVLRSSVGSRLEQDPSYDDVTDFPC